MNEWANEIGETIRNRRLLASGQAVLVAVSGGLDSMVLLRVLHELSGFRRWRLVVAHFNHQLRGRAGQGDERLVRGTAGRLGIEAVIDSGDVKGLAAGEGISIEMAGRRLRHEFLARTARRLGISTVALAHHGDDQVELFLLRLLRGAGGGGLAGMKWSGPSPVDASIRLIRPLLDQSKQVLRQFARAEGVRFRDDATNAQLEFLRNRIRHELIPLLTRKYQPALHRVIPRLMTIVGAEAEFATATARGWLETRRPAFSRLHAAVQRRCLELQLSEKGGAIEFERIEELRTSPGRIVTVNPSLSVWRDSAGLLHSRGGAEGAAYNRNRLRVELSAPAGEVFFDGMTFSWHITRHKNARGEKEADSEFFDVSRVGEVITLRHWQPGDRFQPIGAKSPSKLQDLFVNAKVPRARRRELIVAESAEGGIFWVENLRISERFKLDKGSSRRLKWSWKRSGHAVAGNRASC